ncbi:MAG: hypothetical protein WAX30_16470 [Citrobacter portucalensis]
MTIEKSRFNSEAAPHLNNSQTDILIMRNHEPRIDSRLFADHVGIKHKNLYALIKSHKTELRELGTLPFQTETCAHDTGATVARFALINADQFDYMCRIVRGRDPERMKRFKLDVTKAFAKRRAVDPVRREYLPGYHESREGLKALGAEKHHYINLARAENRVTGLMGGERRSATEQQLGALIVMQKIEQAAFDEAIQNGLSPTDAVREVSRRMETFAALMSAAPMLGANHA